MQTPQEPDPNGSDSDELIQLRRDVARARREAAQWRRTASTSEAMSRHSKTVMLKAHADLQRTVGELRETAAALQESKQRAEAASAAKGQFLAMMSHEMRTPMNGVLGTLDLLLRTGLNGEQAELSDIMYRSATALLQIINDVLDFSKIEAGAMTVELVPFDLRDALITVLDTVRPMAQAKSLVLELAVDDGVPITVLGDPCRLRQVLLNLVGNAVKFTEHGCVSLTAAPSSDIHRVAFEVIDSGIGIAPGAVATIFDVFTQADTSTTRRFGGTGLGLAISRRLVRLMGGELAVDSQVGQGSRFHFEIDLAVGQRPAPTLPAASLPTAATKCKVLVVDDNELNRLIATRMLQRHGCEVVCASDGNEAVVRAANDQFDVIFMDCSMPVMDGYEATQAIRRLPAPAASTRIVAMTAFAMAGDRERCEAAGMDDYLAKPVRLADLQRVLDGLVPRHT